MRKLKLYLLSAASFLLVSLVVFWIAELLIRHSVLSSSTERRDHLVETSYIPVKLKSHYQGIFWEVPFSTNQYGFRGESDFSKTPETGEYRILSLGDSIGFGLGILSSTHYSQVLERNLNQKTSSQKFHVINAGGQGYSPSNYYVYLKHEGLQFRPRMVIVEIELCNDITDEALLHWEMERDKSETLRAVRGGRYILSWDGNLLATYSVGSYFFEKTYVYTDLLRRSLNLLYRLSPTEPFHSQSQNGVCYYNLGFDKYLLDEQRVESGWQRTFRSLVATHRLLEENAIPFLLMIMPSRYMFDEDCGAWSTFAGQLVKRAVGEAQQIGLPYLDLSQAIEEGGGSRLYFDFAHLTEAGNRAVGEALAEYLAVEF